MACLQRLDTARQLCRALEAGDEASAESLISELNEVKSRAMLRQLADLTREVHQSFSGVAFDSKLIEMTKQAMPDARERLSYVIVKMEESVHRTLGAVEEMLGVTEQMTENPNELETILTSGAALETARYAYAAGAISYVELLDAIRSDGQLRADAATAAHDYWVSAAAVMRALGRETTTP